MQAERLDVADARHLAGAEADKEGHDRNLKKQPHVEHPACSLCCLGPRRPAGAQAPWSISAPSIKKGLEKGLGFSFGFFVVLFLKVHHKLLLLDTRNLARHRHRKPAISRHQQPLSREDQVPPWLKYFLGHVSGCQPLNTLRLCREGKISAIANKLARQYTAVMKRAWGSGGRTHLLFLAYVSWRQLPSDRRSPAAETLLPAAS